MYSTPEIQTFADHAHAPHDAALERAFRAPDHHDMPAIQLGVSESRLLTLLMQLIAAHKVVEIGTLAGYSALRLARGLAPGGKVWTFEIEPSYAQIARDNIQAAGLTSAIEVRLAPALQGLAEIEAEGPFDAVFIDADKAGYPEYARWAKKHLRRGGLLIGDNSYYFGQLLDSKDAGAARMREFHAYVSEHFDSVCIPTPDGMVLALAR
jgi:caffeoyl-CoA O-methyltransferase